MAKRITKSRLASALSDIAESSDIISEDIPMVEATSTAPVSDPVVDPITEQQPSTTTGHDETESQFHDDPFDFETGEQGGYEGGVENVIERERSGTEIGTTKRDVPPHTLESRETTTAVGVHALHSDIEIDTSIPLVHAQTSPSHSVSSSQETVSVSHGDSTTSLSVSRSETTGIESRVMLPPTRPFIHAQVSSPHSTQVSSLRGSVPLREVTGTTVEATPSVSLPGSVGSPASAITMPTLSAGHSASFSDSLVVQTGTLSEPGVSFSLPPQFAEHFAKMVNDNVRETLNTIRSEELQSTKGKSIIVPSEPADTQPRQPQSSTTLALQSLSSSTKSPPPEYDPSIQDLQNLLQGKLQSMPSLSAKEFALLRLLKTPATEVYGHNPSKY